MNVFFNKIILVIAISLSLTLYCTGTIAGTTKFEEAKQLLKDGARTYNTEQLEKAKGLFIEISNEEASNYLYPYYVSLTYLELCNIKNYEVEKSKERAEQKVRKAERVALARKGELFSGKSIALNANFSESHRVNGALISYQISGMISGMRYGSKAEESIKKALELDPGNPLAILETARKLIYSPAIVGGDLNGGMKILNNIIKTNPEIEKAYILLGIAYGWLKDKDQAIKTFKDVLAINPANIEAQLFIDDITASK